MFNTTTIIGMVDRSIETKIETRGVTRTIGPSRGEPRRALLLGGMIIKDEGRVVEGDR